MPEPLLTSILEEITHQIEAILPDMADKLLPVGKDILRGHAELLEQWTAQAAAGQLTEKDLNWLVRSRLDLSRLKALESAGLTLVEIDLFRQSLTRTLIGLLASRIVA